MARVSAARDTFLPRIESAFYATFHEEKGPQILFQVPEGLITQGGAGSTASNLYGSRSSNIGAPTRGSTEASNVSSLSVGLVSSPTTLTPSSSSTSISINDETKIDSSFSSHRATSSTSTLDTSSSSPVSHRSNQQHRHLKPSSSSSSPQKPSSPQPVFTTPFLDFSDISRFVIPPQDMCGRLVICSTRTHRVMGFPVCLEAAKYKRVHFRYNLCFVFERTADLSCYEPVVRKIARVLMACEEESSFLSDSNTSHQIYPILEQLYEDLNNYHETSIPIVDQFNSIELKLFPFYPNPAEVDDWTVPLALINLMKRTEPNWDLTMIKACKYIDGINHVSKIASLADCDIELTRKAISHLLYYQCIMTLDIFQYSNIYTLGRSLRWLADDPNVKEECGPYVTRPGYNIQDWPHLLFLYSRLKPGKTVLEWEEEHGVRGQGIDVRRFMSFGVIKGFLRRIHRRPILMPQKPPGTHIERAEVTVDTKMSMGRRRGKSLSHTGKDRPRSPEIQRERSHSHSQSEIPSHFQSRPLTEAEEYARSIQLRGDTSTYEANDSTLRARKSTGGSNRDTLESRRLSWQERPTLRRQNSGPATPRPAPANLPTIESYRQHFRPTNYNASPSPDRYPNFAAPAYPPELPALLDGTHHTDELATRFEAGWPALEKWLVALGGGEGNGDFGRVAIIYR